MRTINTGIRITRERLDRLDAMAAALGISRNAAISVLVDNAVIRSVPQVDVAVKKNSQGAQLSTAGTLAISA